MLGSPNPLTLPFRPASSINGSTVAKFMWLKALVNVARKSNPIRSLILKFLMIDALATFEIASCTGLRGALPNGVPKTCCDWPEFMMNRTWSLVTATNGQGFVGSLSHPDLPTAVKLMSWFGFAVQSGSVPENEKVAQASPANIPTLVAGALRLPRNGRAVSIPAKFAM